MMNKIDMTNIEEPAIVARPFNTGIPRLATQQKSKKTTNVANCVQAVGKPSYYFVFPKIPQAIALKPPVPLLEI